MIDAFTGEAKGDFFKLSSTSQPPPRVEIKDFRIDGAW